MIAGFMRALLDLFKIQILIYQNHYLSLKRLAIHFLKMVLSGLKLQNSKMIKIGFIRENGEPTYYLTDVGYHKNKIDREYDLCINIFGADHHGYITRLTAAFDVMKKEKARNRTYALSIG